MKKITASLISGLKFFVPGIVSCIFFSALFGGLAFIDSYGNLQLWLHYFFAFLPLFAAANLFTLVYSRVNRRGWSMFSQFFLMALIILSLGFAVTGSHLMKMGLGLEEVDFYQFPRTLAFVPAAAFFFIAARTRRKSLKISAVGSAYSVFLIWFVLSAIPIPSFSRPADPRLDQKPNILLLSIESLRYDHLGKTSRNRVKTENLDRIGNEGLFFSHYSVQAPYTTASLATLMTGFYPFHHGSRAFGETPKPGFTPFLTRLKDQGYTISVDSSYFEELFDFSSRLKPLKRSMVRYLWEKFSTIQYNIVNPALGKLYPRLFGKFCFGYNTSLYQASSLMRQIRATKKGRWFFWTHFTVNCHWPYSAPDFFIRWYRKENLPPLPSISRETILALNKNPEAITGERRADIDTVYSAEVSCVDRQIGMIIDLLKRCHLLDKTLVLITADHGEMLGENGFIGHGEKLKESLLHVPLILYSSSRQILPVRGEFTETVEEIDIAPTILDVCGIEFDEEAFDGRSLLPFVRGESRPERSSYAEVVSSDGAQFSTSYKKGDFKLIWDSSTQMFSLFNLKKDPVESEDIKQRRPEIVAELKEDCLRLTDFTDFHQLIPERSKKLDAEMEKKIRALGYIK